MKREKNPLGVRPQYASSRSLAPPAPLFRRLSQQTTRYTAGPLPTLVPLNPVVVLPTQLHPTRSAPVVIVFLVTSLRDRNTFKHLMSESWCVLETLERRASEPSEPCVLIDGSNSCLYARDQLNLLFPSHPCEQCLLALLSTSLSWHCSSLLTENKTVCRSCS